MGHPTDSSTLGIFPFQDHEEDVHIGIRQRLLGGRIERIEQAPDGKGFVVYATEDDRGTVGDVHPFCFWQGGEERGFGSWNSVFASLSQGGTPSGNGKPITLGGAGSNPEGRDHPVFRSGGATDPNLGRTTGREDPPGHMQRALPIRHADYSEDDRYVEREAEQPEYLPLYPAGYRLIAAAGTHEGAQENLLLPADGRIVVPQANGPDEMGTTYADMVLPGELGSDGPYGVGARDAPGQTLHWVVRLPELGKLRTVEANALALNGTRTNQGQMAGFMPFVGRTLFGGPTTEDPAQDDRDPVVTPSGGDPSTDGGGGGDTVPWSYDGDGSSPGSTVPWSYDGPGDAVAPGGRSTARTSRGGTRRASFGGTAVAFAMHEAAGPWVAGFQNDVHQHGTTKDGQPINAGHLHIDAYWIHESGPDGPHEHALEPYPHPTQVGYPWVTNIYWDATDVHPFMDGVRPGKWRRATWVPLLVGGPDEPREPQDPPEDTPREPQDPPTTPRHPADDLQDPVPPPPPPPTPTPTTPSAPSTPTPPDIGGGGRPDGGGTIPEPSVPGPVGNGEGPITVSVRPYDHAGYAPERVIDSPMQTGLTSTVWRAQPLTQGAPDLRYATHSPQAAQAERDRRPIVHRTEAIGIELESGEFDYHRLPHQSRNVGGESAGGGVWHMPAVFDSVDYRDGAPPNVEYASTYRGFADGICVAFGLPSNTQGVQDGGLRMLREDGGVKLQEVAAGSWGSHTPSHDDHLATVKYVDDNAAQQGAAVADFGSLSVTSGPDTVDLTDLNSRMATIQTKVNTLLASLRAAGHIAT